MHLSLYFSLGVESRFGTSVGRLEWLEDENLWSLMGLDGQNLGQFKGVVATDKNIVSPRFTSVTGRPPPLGMHAPFKFFLTEACVDKSLQKFCVKTSSSFLSKDYLLGGILDKAYHFLWLVTLCMLFPVDGHIADIALLVNHLVEMLQKSSHSIYILHLCTIIRYHFLLKFNWMLKHGGNST